MPVAVRDFCIPDDQALLMDMIRRGEEPPDLLIGVGRKTHWPLARARMQLGSRAVLLMKPSLPAFFFDLCLVPEHDRLLWEYRVLRTQGMLGPNVQGQRDPSQGVILLGGVSQHFSWDSMAVAETVRGIVEQAPNVDWTVCDSPRSPTELGTALQLPGNARFVHWRDCSGDWLSQQLSQVDQVWVSADSASMLYEAVASCALVGVIELPSSKSLRNNKLQRGIDLLLEKRRLGVVAQGRLDQQRLVRDPLQEHIRCARWILASWFNVT